MMNSEPGTEKELNSDTLVDHGEMHHQAGRQQEAEQCYRKALEMDPGHPGALYLLANIAYDDNRLSVATQLVEELLRGDANDVEAWHLLGRIAYKEDSLLKAIECLRKALAIQPAYFHAHLALAAVFSKQGEFDAALATYDTVLALKTDCVEAHVKRGQVLLKLNRLDEALAGIDKAIALKPEYAELYCDRGFALAELMRLEAARACYDKAIQLKPDYAEAYHNRGLVLMELRRFDVALLDCNKAVKLKPAFAEAYNSRGLVLMKLGRVSEAVVDFSKAVALNPNFAEAYFNYGNVLDDTQQLEEALVRYERAIELKPQLVFALGTLLYTKMRICDWRGLGDMLQKLEAGLLAGLKVAMPFPVLALLDAPELHLNAARIYVEAKFPKTDELGKIASRATQKKIRIGYYSADFRNHATSYLIAQLFELHDIEKFDLYGFSFGPVVHDEMHARVRASFSYFVEVGDLGDVEVAKQSRDLGIDIAIDLKGFTQDARPGIFAARCAPVQVSYLGYPGTMGADYIDYIIADKTVIPENARCGYTEKVVYLPGSYQVNDSKRKIADRQLTRQSAGLPDTGFVFCCFNNSHKIMPMVFASWMRILNAVPGSALWLFADHPAAARNLRMEATSHGVHEDRLVFAQRKPLDEHLARYQLADLFLDTQPYNAHTTASDALWAGTPVLTRAGKSFASRVAASLLLAIDLPELIAHTEVEYETKAIELALFPKKLSELKQKLSLNRKTAPLFDTRLFARNIESAYVAMYTRHQAGLSPAGMEVSSENLV